MPRPVPREFRPGLVSWSFQRSNATALAEASSARTVNYNKPVQQIDHLKVHFAKAVVILKCGCGAAERHFADAEDVYAVGDLEYFADFLFDN